MATIENLIKFEFPKIKHCKEYELLKELNKQNKEEYEKWLYKRILTDKILRDNSYRAYAA